MGEAKFETGEAASRPSALDLGAYLRRPKAAVAEVDVQSGLERAMRHATQSSDKRKSADAEDVQFALGAIEAALFAIDDIRDLLEEACEVALAARELEDEAGRALLADRYDELRLAIDPIADEAEYEGVQLLSKRAKPFDLELGVKARFSITPFRLNLGDKGLDLPPPRHAFEKPAEAEAVIAKLDRALQQVDRAAETYCRDARFLSARLELREKSGDGEVSPDASSV